MSKQRLGGSHTEACEPAQQISSFSHTTPHAINASKGERRDGWSDEEHARFLEAIELYGSDWKAVERHVATKNVMQIRLHAQEHHADERSRLHTEGHIDPPGSKRKLSSCLETQQTSKGNHAGSVRAQHGRCAFSGVKPSKAVASPSTTATTVYDGSACEHDRNVSYQRYRAHSAPTPATLAEPYAQGQEHACPHIATVYNIIAWMLRYPSPSVDEVLKALQRLPHPEQLAVLHVMDNLSNNIDNPAMWYEQRNFLRAGYPSLLESESDPAPCVEPLQHGVGKFADASKNKSNSGHHKSQQTQAAAIRA